MEPGEVKESCNSNVRSLGVGDLNESGDVSVMVQKRVEFDSTFVLSKSGPREKRKAQVHDSRIERVEFAFEAKSLLGGHGAAFRVQVIKNGLEKLRRAVLVCIGKCRALHSLYSQMVDPAGLCSKL